MGRRWTLSGQLLALQLVIVAVVLVAVAAVSLAQTSASFGVDAGRRALAVAEIVAATGPLRTGLESRDDLAQAPAEDPSADLTIVRSVAGSASTSSAMSVVVLDSRGRVAASEDPSQLGRSVSLPGDVLATGRSWVGAVGQDEAERMLAQVPVQSDDPGRAGEVVGTVAVSRQRPTLLQDLGAAAPNLLVYLGVASGLGVAGSLLVARRVKRQTLGLEPLEITGLVEHRDATLHGIREGIIAVDLAGRVTLVNDVARSLLHLPYDTVARSVDDLGLPPDVPGLLVEQAPAADVPFAVRDRVLVLNRMPIRSHGRLIGWVTTLRDRTELVTLQHELAAVSDVTQTLRAQAHEFSNRMHTISGLIELGEYGEVVRYVDGIGRRDARVTQSVTSHVADPAVAALLLAKTSLADERGVELRVAPTSRLGVLDDELSNDVATVVGNLVDNAVDAASTGRPDAGGEVEVELVPDDAGGVRVTVRDSGPGIAPGVAGELFQRGVSTKPPVAGGRGIGLSLVQLICTRRGGSVDVREDGATVFVAHLPARVEVAAP